MQGKGKAALKKLLPVHALPPSAPLRLRKLSVHDNQLEGIDRSERERVQELGKQNKQEKPLEKLKFVLNWYKQREAAGSEHGVIWLSVPLLRAAVLVPTSGWLASLFASLTIWDPRHSVTCLAANTEALSCDC